MWLYLSAWGYAGFEHLQPQLKAENLATTEFDGGFTTTLIDSHEPDVIFTVGGNCG